MGWGDWMGLLFLLLVFGLGVWRLSHPGVAILMVQP